MKQTIFVLAYTLLGLFLLPSCNQPSDLGSEIFEEDQIGIISSDTFSIIGKTIQNDPFKTRDETGFNISNLICGQYTDPVFGELSSEIFAKYLPGSVIRDSSSWKNDPANTTIDSIVLSLVYAQTLTANSLTSAYFYGDSNDEIQTMEINRVAELMPEADECLSDKSFAVEPTPLKTFDFEAKASTQSGLADSLSIVEYINDEPVDFVVTPHLRVHLDNSLAEELLYLFSSFPPQSELDQLQADEFNALDQTYIDQVEDVLKGLNIKITSDNNSILNFNINSSLSNLNIYYRTGNITKQLILDPYLYHHINLEHTYTGSVIEPFFNDYEKGNEYLFVQGGQGVDIQLEFPYLNDINDVIINKASLELFAVELPEDNIDVFDQPFFIEVYEENADGDDIFVEDLNFALIQGNTSLFGGSKEEMQDSAGNNIYKYSFNLSSHMQRIIDGNVNATIKLKPSVRSQFPGRAVFAGPGHPELKPKLTLVYTDLN